MILHTMEVNPSDEHEKTMMEVLRKGQCDSADLKALLPRLRRLSDDDLAATLDSIAECSRDGECYEPTKDAMLTFRRGVA